MNLLNVLIICDYEIKRFRILACLFHPQLSRPTISNENNIFNVGKPGNGSSSCFESHKSNV